MLSGLPKSLLDDHSTYDHASRLVARTATPVRKSLAVFFLNMFPIKRISQLHPSVPLGQILQRVAACSRKRWIGGLPAVFQQSERISPELVNGYRLEYAPSRYVVYTKLQNCMVDVFGVPIGRYCQDLKVIGKILAN